jgi:hypothetical protein
VLQLGYTAREGGRLLRDAAVSSLNTSVADAVAAGSTRLFSVRHDFPNEWAQFTAVPVPANGFRELSLELREEHYPFWARRLLADALSLRSAYLLASPADGGEISVAGQTGTLAAHESVGARIGSLDLTPADTPVGTFTRQLSDNTMTDLWLALTFGAAP